MDIETEIRQYIETALWSSSDNSDDSGGVPLDDAKYGVDALSSEAREQMGADVVAFIESNSDSCRAWAAQLGPGQIGHDLWLTRNGHGAGFWDRFMYLPDRGTALNNAMARFGERLADVARTEGTFDLYVGDDGKIYGN